MSLRAKRSNLQTAHATQNTRPGKFIKNYGLNNTHLKPCHHEGTKTRRM